MIDRCLRRAKVLGNDGCTDQCSLRIVVSDLAVSDHLPDAPEDSGSSECVVFGLPVEQSMFALQLVADFRVDSQLRQVDPFQRSGKSAGFHLPDPVKAAGVDVLVGHGVVDRHAV